MAQIIKYKQGGSTSQKYGTFTIDGNQFNVDDEFLNQITNYGKSLDDETAYQFSKITDALKSGADLLYDSNADRLDGKVQFDVTDRQDNRLGKRRSRIGRFFGNSWRGQENASRNAIHALKGFTYIKPTSSGTDYDWSKRINVEYKKDKDGKYELVNGKRVFIQGANNLQLIRRLKSLKDISSYTDNDTFKGYNNLDKQVYIDLYNRLGDKGVENLIQRIEDGTWTDEDKLALDDIGAFLDGELSNENSEKELLDNDKQAPAEQKERERYQKARLNYNLRNIFGVDDNGKITIIDPTLQSYIGTGDAWLNDEFRKVYSAYADYIPEKTGFFVINGKVYRGDDQNSLSKIQKYLDFVSENRKTAGNAANIKQYWKEDDYSGWSDLGYDSNGNPIYSAIFKPGEFGRDVSGEYVRDQNSPYIFDYFKGYDAEDDSLFDQYGHPLRSKATRVFIDPRTKKPIDINDPRYKEYIATLRPQTNKQAVKNYYESASGSAFSPYYNLGPVGNIVRIIGTGSDTNPFTGYSLFQKPGSNLYYWYDQNPGDNDYILNNLLPSGADKMSGYIWNIDPELGELLAETPDMLRDIRVKNLISDYIRNPYTATVGFRRTQEWGYPELLRQYPKLKELVRRFDKKGPILGYGNYRKAYGYLGGSNPELRSIQSPEELEARGLAYRVDRLGQIPYQKQGGILRLQIGGTTANRAKAIRASEDSIQRANLKLRSAGEDKVIGDRTELNSTDKAELAALIADAASLGATFIPVYGNATSAGIGAIGSITGFGADVARDGLDWVDVGRLALNLGLDAATLLPAIGTGAKTAKVAKALKNSKAVAKVIKWASRGLSGASTINGLTTAWNNIQDGTWTIKDVRTVLNGIRGAANLKRITGSAKTRVTTGDTITLQSQSKDLPSIRLNKTELESIQSVPKSNRVDKLEELLISKLPKNTKTDNISDILAEYGIDRSNTFNWNWRAPFKFNRSNTINTRQFKYDEIPGIYRNPNQLSWWNLNRRATIRDAKINRNNPYFKDFSRSQTSEITYTPLEIIRRPEIDGSVARSQILTPSIQITSYRRAPITRPIYSNFAPDLGIFSINPELRYYYDPNNRPTFYKKGGKVIKAQKGIRTGPNIHYDFTDEYNKEFGDNVGKVDYFGTTGGPRIYKQLGLGISPEVKTGLETLLTDPPELKTQTLDKYTSSESRYGGENKGGIGNLLSKVNPDAVFGTADFITSSTGINRTTQRMKDAIRKGMIGSQQQMPTEFYSRFSDNGLYRMYDDRIKNMRQYKTMTNDPNRVMAEQLTRDMYIDQIESERNTKLSQMINQYNDKLLAQKQQYANIRNQITNENKNRWYQGLAQLDMADANKIGQQTQNVKNLIYQFRQNNARDLQEKAQAQVISQRLKADNAYKTELLSKYSYEYTPEMQKLYDSLEDYVSAKHPKEQQEIFNKHYANLFIDQYNEGRSHGWWGRAWIPRYETPNQYTPQSGSRNTEIIKKGGTIQRFRNVDEQAYLDQQKAINKAVNDLNNNIIKLFLKMMS